MGAKELSKYSTVIRWGNRVKLARPYLWSLNSFIEWAKANDPRFIDATPDSLVEYQRSLDNGNQFELLDVVQNFINSLKGRASTKLTTYHQIRSFFAHNRTELPRDQGFIVNGDKLPVKGTLSPVDIRALLMSSNKMHKALYISMFQGCLDLEMLIYWSDNGYEALRNNLEKKIDVIRVDLPGRKKAKFKKPYYTFIGPDAVQALREYLPDPLPHDREAIFFHQYRGKFKPISKDSIYRYWHRHIKKLGLISKKKIRDENVNRYGKNPHEMRDVWRTLWSKSPADHRVGEYFMGHVVDPLGYDKSFDDEAYTRKEYEKALSFLNLLTSDQAYGKVDEDQLRQQADRIAELERLLEEERIINSGRIADLERSFIARIEAMEKRQQEHFDKEK